MESPGKKLRAGALKIVGRVCGMSSNQSQIPDGKSVVTVVVNECGKNRETFQLIVPMDESWRLFGAQCEITIVPMKDGKPVEWLLEKN